MKATLAREVQEINMKLRLIDDIPTRSELIQYEKRFMELYEEVIAYHSISKNNVATLVLLFRIGGSDAG